MKAKYVLIVLVLLALAGGGYVALRAGRVVPPVERENEDGAIMRPALDMLAAANRWFEEQRLSVRLDLDTYCLARAIASEHGREPEIVQRWVGHAILNTARKRGIGVYQLCTMTGNKAQYRGHFARQRTDGRYVATNQTPRTEHVEVARQVMRATTDPTGGATNFFSPATQDRLFAAGTPGIRRDAAATIELWTRQYRWRLIGPPPGISERKVLFFAA